jgi:hypothetical protein
MGESQQVYFREFHKLTTRKLVDCALAICRHEMLSRYKEGQTHD